MILTHQGGVHRARKPEREAFRARSSPHRTQLIPTNTHSRLEADITPCNATIIGYRWIFETFDQNVEYTFPREVGEDKKFLVGLTVYYFSHGDD